MAFQRTLELQKLLSFAETLSFYFFFSALSAVKSYRNQHNLEAGQMAAPTELVGEESPSSTGHDAG